MHGMQGEYFECSGVDESKNRDGTVQRSEFKDQRSILTGDGHGEVQGLRVGPDPSEGRPSYW